MNFSMHPRAPEDFIWRLSSCKNQQGEKVAFGVPAVQARTNWAREWHLVCSLCMRSHKAQEWRVVCPLCMREPTEHERGAWCARFACENQLSAGVAHRPCENSLSARVAHRASENQLSA